MMAATSLPTHQLALVQEVYGQPLIPKEVATPEAIPGTAVVKIISVPIISYAKEVYNGTRKYPYPTPIIPGTGAIGRVAALGPDSTSLKVGDLVYADPVIRSRDAPSDAFLHGLAETGTEGSKKLINEVWRDGTLAEYTRAPLEAVFHLDEERLVGELKYSYTELSTILRYLVGYGGLKDIGLQAGETIVVAPATGGFGGAAVAVAHAMGASVIAMGRNEDALKDLRELLLERIKTVKLTEDVEQDVESLKRASGGSIDAVLDIAPPMAAKSNFLKSCLHAIKIGGRISLMGGILEDVSIPYRLVMQKDLALKGKWMYGRDEIAAMIKMVESGVLKIGKAGGVKVIREYDYKDWEKAFDDASEHGRWDSVVAMGPSATTS
ncbi:alcohol dehydrogenase [Corynespora cassiicola Philippines]|uniref:Alcohol dehydrogenase n=1 Tax=Corynespora cassiicola Philippines TaxID=1448308 RepID=A0A2T2N509_CORCC|nr:alcohol dehydrogenase [Corynespora cassiicola Philippines]